MPSSPKAGHEFKIQEQRPQLSNKGQYLADTSPYRAAMRRPLRFRTRRGSRLCRETTSPGPPATTGRSSPPRLVAEIIGAPRRATCARRPRLELRLRSPRPGSTKSSRCLRSPATPRTRDSRTAPARRYRSACRAFRAARMARAISQRTASLRSSNRCATVPESRSRPSVSCVRSLDPIENPSKTGETLRRESRSTALRTSRRLRARLRPVAIRWPP